MAGVGAQTSSPASGGDGHLRSRGQSLDDALDALIQSSEAAERRLGGAAVGGDVGLPLRRVAGAEDASRMHTVGGVGVEGGAGGGPDADMDAPWEQVTAAADETWYNVADATCEMVAARPCRRRVATAAILSEHAYKTTDKHYTHYHALKRLQMARAHWGDLVQLEGAVETIAMPNKKTPPMIVARDADTMYIAFRGTKHLSDWISDVHIRKTQLRGTPKGCEVHKGFRSRAEHYRNDILFDVIAHGIETEKRHVVLTGHSLGGAVACVKLTETLLQYAQWSEFAEGASAAPTAREATAALHGRGPFLKAITFACPYWCNQALADHLSTGAPARVSRSMHNFFHPRDRVPTWTRSVGFEPVGWYYYTNGPIERGWIRRQFVDSSEQKTCTYVAQDEDVLAVVAGLCVVAGACVDLRGQLTEYVPHWDPSASYRQRESNPRGHRTTSHVDPQLLESFANPRAGSRDGSPATAAYLPEQETSHHDVRDYSLPYFVVLKNDPNEVLDHAVIEKHLLLARKAQQHSGQHGNGSTTPSGAAVSPASASRAHAQQAPPLQPFGKRFGWGWGLLKSSAGKARGAGGEARSSDREAAARADDTRSASWSPHATTPTNSVTTNSIGNSICLPDASREACEALGTAAASGGGSHRNGSTSRSTEGGWRGAGWEGEGLCPSAHVTPATLRSGDAYGVFRTASPTSDFFAASRNLRDALFTAPPPPPPPPVTFTEALCNYVITFRVHPSGHAVEYLVNGERPRPPISYVEYERVSTGHVLRFPELGADKHAFLAPTADTTAVLRGLSLMFERAHVRHNLPSPVSPNKGLLSFVGKAIAQAATTVKTVGSVLSQASNVYSTAVKEPHRVQMFVLTFLISWGDGSYEGEEPLTTLSASTAGGCAGGLSRGPTLESMHSQHTLDEMYAEGAGSDEEECVDVDFDYFDESDADA